MRGGSQSKKGMRRKKKAKKKVAISREKEGNVERGKEKKTD